MQNTPNFNFNLPEGTDLWNYLTQTNPNFTSIDTLLKSIQDGTVTTATEVTSGTAHAVTRTLPDANVIRFTATGVWTLGDTMTIDGTPVTVVKPNGTSLQTGDYIIGSGVLGILRDTQFTVYVGGSSSVDAEDVDYNNTGSGLTATNVQGAIDEVNSNLADLSNYSTSETAIGTWINGKTIYRKVVDLGALPNASAKYVNIGVVGMTDIVKIYGKASNGIDYTLLPHVNPKAPSYGIDIGVSSATGQIYVITDADYSGFTGYAVIEYTK